MITWQRGTQRIVADEKPIRVHVVRGERSGWTAAIEVQRDVYLHVTANQDDASVVELTLTAGLDRHGKGVAVVWRDERPSALAPIPLCTCGDYGCGNVHRQLWGDGRTAQQLLRTLDILGALPMTKALPQSRRDHGPTWTGDFDENGHPFLD